MVENSNKDHIYTDKRNKIDDFVFDENVANVFEDMVQRSVPGYMAVYKMLPIIANRYVKPASNVYDLGCSLGEASLSIANSIQADGVNIFAVDNSQAMIDQLNKRILEDELKVPIETVCEDVSKISIENASFVVLNYTLQFIQPSKRDTILKNIYAGMKENAALLLSEKIKYEDVERDEQMRKQHEEFKRDNDYSNLEISQKRESLENVLIRDTHEEHMQRLQNAGFKKINILAEYLNFISYVAVK